jgi:ubiquinone/menaquinone biosynthesis C-methylase UbiE
MRAEHAFPNDERELERLDMQHAMQTMLLKDKLFWSPIGRSPQRVLDLGTGTGTAIPVAPRSLLTILGRNLGD